MEKNGRDFRYLYCGDKYHLSDSFISRKLKLFFCSQKCRKLSNRKEIKCKNCGKKFVSIKSEIKRGGGKFCSMSCANTGRFNNNYRGIKIRTKTKVWIKISKKLRNNNKCSICGIDENLVVHHIIPYKINQNNNIDNLVVLCRKCHGKIEHLTSEIYGKFTKNCGWSAIPHKETILFVKARKNSKIFELFKQRNIVKI